MMKFGPRRGHVMFIFERFFRDFGLLIAAVIISLILQDYQKLWQDAPVLVVVFIAPIARLIQYLTTYYSIDDERLLVESGWINKKRQEIPLANITTVDFTQNIFFQLAKVYSVNVDNASSISGDSGKVKMAFKISDAIEVKKLLLAKGDESDTELHDNQISEDTSGNTILTTVGEILIMGLLKSKVLVIIQIFAYGGIAISLFTKLFMKKSVDGQELIMESLFRISVPLLIGALILALYLLSVAVSVVLNTIKYYGFRVTNRENSIFIEYGLLTKKTYTLMKSKISGVSYNQPLLMRIFGRGTLEVFAVGYGGAGDEDNQEVAILYPVLKKEHLHAFLQRYLPEAEAREEYVRTERKAIPYFFLCGRFFFSLILLATMMFDWSGHPIVRACLLAAGILIFAAAVISVLLEYCNTSIYGNAQLISLTCGSFTKRTVFLKTEKVESIEERATIRKKQSKQLTTIRFGVLGPKAVSKQWVRNMDLELFERMKNKLVY